MKRPRQPVGVLDRARLWAKDAQRAGFRLIDIHLHSTLVRPLGQPLLISRNQLLSNSFHQTISRSTKIPCSIPRRELTPRTRQKAMRRRSVRAATFKGPDALPAIFTPAELRLILAASRFAIAACMRAAASLHFDGLWARTQRTDCRELARPKAIEGSKP